MHQHGGSPERDLQRLGVQPGPLIDFSVNISPLGPPDPVRDLWPELITQLEHYPAMDGDGVKRFYRDRYDLEANCVLPGNGSIDLIYSIPRILNLKRVRVPQPSFHDYVRACEAGGAERVAGDMEHLDDVDALFIGNPNNPTGEGIPASDLLDLARRFPRVLLLVDEAFIQFSDRRDQCSLMAPQHLRRNIIVLHSLTKFYALPGLRLGACISHPDTIARLGAQRAPWMVSRVAERIAECLIDCHAYEQQLTALISRERERVFRALGALPALRPLQSEANFMLVQWTGSPDLDDLLRHLLDQGLYVRDSRNFEGLQRNWFRTAIRLPEENDRLLKSLRAA